ncbi:unnamed protein product [Penicillium salamii]|uniref:Uncharacterized protein n=1 Tax=Penicillium salamii TaxID=1612424 RepID=A0A9W4JV99_9EURO|nr:unnamed protein product [Penicillium salamii]CAG8194748.1 unnamed protein product [Penicillium salamii]CAG8307785.1 unnamed protein product [Penicillium salamii]CAG8360158.1 unnamed protein product [Penicillium salamii]CAG8406215.1 unnamed protein product [Penicillium salamii]
MPVMTRSMTAGKRPPIAPPLTKEEKVAAKAAKAQERAEAKRAKAEAKAIRDQVKAAKAAAKASAKASGKVSKVKKSKTSKKAKTSKTTKTSKKPKLSEKRVYEEDESEDEADYKRRKTSDSDSSTYIEVSSKKGYHTKPPSLAESISIDIKEWVYSRELPRPKGLQTNIETTLPKIHVGGSAPQPRWLVAQSKSIPPPPALPGFHCQSGSSTSTDYGGLVWYFDEGDYKCWKGLQYPQLFELAYKCFEDTLKDEKLKNEINNSLANGPIAKHVTRNAGWEPTLPPPPYTRYFGLGPDSLPWEASKTSGDGYYFADQARPTLAVRPSKSVAQPYQHMMATKILDQITTASDSGSDGSRPNSIGRAQGSRPAESSSQVDSGIEVQSNRTDQKSDSGRETGSETGESRCEQSDNQSGSEKVSRRSSVAEHDGLFNPEEIEDYYSARGLTFQSDSVGGKRGAESPLDEEGEKKRVRLEEEEVKDTEMGGTKDKEKGREAPEEVPAAPLAPDVPDVPDFSDQFYKDATAICENKTTRLEHFPDPETVRGVRMWAGEDTTATGPDLDAVLPAWADNHRPFHPWVEVSTLNNSIRMQH